VTVPNSEDFTIASMFESVERLEQIHTALDRLGTGRQDTTRRDIDEYLPSERGLATDEAEALFVGLVLNDVAEKSTRSDSFVNSTFKIDVNQAQTVLEEQLVAQAALEEHSQSDRTGTRTEVVTTVPDELDIELPDGVGDLDTRVRSALLTADDVVRIANPYFDPNHPTVETLQTLPQRGIKTRILTRKMIPGTDRYDVLTEMNDSLSESEKDRLNIRELFARDDTGHLAYATHAKLIIADNTRCYLGSANFTITNLSDNFEMGILTSGPEVSLAAATFDRVFEKSRTVDLG